MTSRNITKLPKPPSKAELKRQRKAARLEKVRNRTPEEKAKAAKAADARLRQIFNITSEEYEKVLAYQNGVCYISQQPPNEGLSLSVDHRHSDGLTRGLLSPWVNKGLSYFKDDPAQLRRAADYLDNPPVTIALGEAVYGVMGKSTKKAASRKYGPTGTKTPQPRTVGPLYKKKKDDTN